MRPIRTMIGQPCDGCGTTATGPRVRTPHGICEGCACTACRGFGRFDDRGHIVMVKPSLYDVTCKACGGLGTRTAQETQRQTKVCVACRERKPLEDFYLLYRGVRTPGPRGVIVQTERRQSRCKACDKAKRIEQRRRA